MSSLSDTYSGIEAYTADVEKARTAHALDRRHEDGLCITCDSSPASGRRECTRCRFRRYRRAEVAATAGVSGGGSVGD